MQVLRGRRLRPDRRPARTPAGTALLDWTVRYAVPLISVVGLALYGVLRLAYVLFYAQLRATPQEVGYGYVEILSSQLVGTIELVLVVTIVFLVIACTGHGIRRLVVRMTGRRVRRNPGRRLVARLVLRCAWAALVVVLILLPIAAWLEGTEARNGYTIRNVHLAGTVRIPVLAVQAVPAELAWSVTSPPGLQNLMERRCLLFLGQAAGTTVFYDVQTRESLRVPTAQIVVSLQNTDGVPVGC
ncbi:hypothetical protein AB0F81_35740 [Actinoplanes sp. NPDC024001]|uniref:hypothetical protein n=1 Tax=Actinoplanes sp. NPDC024001 TaxID=3154598 RepID=UPI003403EFCF